MVSLEFFIQFSPEVRLPFKYVVFELIEVALHFEGAFCYDFFDLVDFALPVFVRVLIQVSRLDHVEELIVDVNVDHASE